MNKNIIFRPTLLAAFCLLMLVNACSNVEYRSAHPYELDDENTANNNGYVTARVINNNNIRLSTFWTDLVVTAAETTPEGKQKAYYVPTVAGSGLTRFFFGVLPPGDYAISHLRRFSPGTNEIHYAPAPSTLGTFSIVLGRITDLAVMIYQPLPSEKSSSLFTISRDEDGLDTFPLIEAAFSDVAPKIARDRTFGWRKNSSGASQEIKEKLLDISLKHPQFTGRLFSLTDGRVLGLTKLGFVLIRETNGQWHAYDTGYRTYLNDFHALSAGGYIISGELGLLLYTEDLSMPWKRLKTPKPAAEIVQIISDNDGGVFVYTRSSSEEKEDGFLFGPSAVSNSQINIFHSVDPVNGNWNEFNLPKDLEDYSAISFDHGHLYLVTNGRRVSRYTFESESWDEIKLPLNKFHADSNGGQISYSSAYSDKPNLLVIRNNTEESWRKVNLYADNLPIHDDRGRWFVNARMIIPLAEGSRKTVPDVDMHLFMNKPNDESFNPIGPGLDCGSFLGSHISAKLRWESGMLWGYCWLNSELHHYDFDTNHWVKEVMSVPEEQSTAAVDA